MKNSYAFLDSLVSPDLTRLRSQIMPHYARLHRLQGQRHPIEEGMDEFDRAHPEMTTMQLKAALYGYLAENFTPVIFDDSPFYFVTDLSRCVMQGSPFWSAGGWLLRRNEHVCRELDPEAHDRYEAMKRGLLFTGSHLYFDSMHYCYPVDNVVKHGLKYFHDKACAALDKCESEEERQFIQCAIAGLKAARRCAQRYGEAARQRLAQLNDPVQRRCMQMIADTTDKAPWEKPEHFYEGLNTLFFCRDLMGNLEGVNSSHLGRIDLTLRELYEKDIASGYMTRQDAYDLICRFLQHGDCQYDRNSGVIHQNDHELEMGYILGGYDRDGQDVYNEITAMFIRAHRAQGVIYPKAHYRFNEKSCDAYLNDISTDFVNGRSIGGLINDDALIPCLVRAGKTIEDARSYINYGCWGILVEGMENTTGGNFIHTLTVMERSIYGDDEHCRAVGVHCEPIEGAQSFEEVYRIYFSNLIRIIRDRLQIIGKYGVASAMGINPMPMFSAFVDGCIENRRDLLAGGSKYQINSFAIAELANTVDSLLAIKDLCFDRQVISLPDFLSAVRNNWEGHEALRESLRRCPHYGDESEASMGMARRLFEDIYENTRDVKNEFGTPYMVDLFLYQEFRFHAEHLRATPDGRKNGDIVALGVNPGRFHSASMPAVIHSITAIDPEKAENHSLTLQLPAAHMSTERMTAILRACQQMQMKHIQVNCVDMDTLLDAQKHPENHQDLVVRICGFSARFVSLSPEWQDEFIHRVMLSA